MKKMSEHEKNAKMGVLHHLKQMAEGMMKDHMDGHGMKKVSVMSDSPEGLQEGLEKAKQLAGHADMASGDPLEGQHPSGLVHGDVNMPGHSTHGSGMSDPDSLDDGSSPMEDEAQGDDESPEAKDEASEHSDNEEDMHPDHIDAKIKHLMDLKKRKMGM